MALYGRMTAYRQPDRGGWLPSSATLVQSMDLAQMLSELRTELLQIEEAILVLERLAASGGRRRGRPPKWMASSPEQSSLAISIVPKGPA
jgi:hypothetical protein